MPSSKFWAISDRGLLRENNEDNFLSSPDEGLWLVADGMGGHEAGEVASAIVVDAIRREIDRGKSLTLAIEAAHRAVIDAAREGLGASGMGSTVIALQNRGEDYEIAWVGDSRAYLWTQTAGGGRLERLSTDHSYVQMLVASGAIAQSEADSHPDRNVITQCIGSPEANGIQVDSLSGHWERGQWILLCSDGLSDEIDDQEMARILARQRSLRRAADKLLQTALARGGRDNITLQIIESPLGSRRELWPPPGFARDEAPPTWLLTAAGALALLLTFWALS